MLHKEGYQLVDVKKEKKRAEAEYPLSMVKLLITLWMVYQYTQSLQRFRNP